VLSATGLLDPETLFTELDALSERGIRTETSSTYRTAPT